MVQLNPAYGYLLNQTDIPLTRALSMAPSLSLLTGFDSTCDENQYFIDLVAGLLKTGNKKVFTSHFAFETEMMRYTCRAKMVRFKTEMT